jgi:ribosomal protein L40E
MSDLLIDSHPRIGLAQWERRFEQDCTGDCPGQRFCEILHHDFSIGVCNKCGARERRHAVRYRLLVGCNAGEVCQLWLFDRPACAHGSESSNYCVPWRDW